MTALQPDYIDVHVCAGLPSLTVYRNGKQLASRWELMAADALSLHMGEKLPLKRITVDVRESVEASPATLAAWIAQEVQQWSS